MIALEREKWAIGGRSSASNRVQLANLVVSGSARVHNHKEIILVQCLMALSIMARGRFCMSNFTFGDTILKVGVNATKFSSFVAGCACFDESVVCKAPISRVLMAISNPTCRCHALESSLGFIVSSRVTFF